ncbi:low specificity L-threonine aldolase [Sphingosinicellaceae bacterium]|nr:low specificity L-threonine aldolase [Sphingosinicellaceae bacterium]
MNFMSDNAAAACDEVLAAVVAANRATTRAYDGDDWSGRLDGVFGDYFGAPCTVFAVSTGTAANALALAAMTPPYGAVVCHREAHINVDECGAPEFFTGGAKLMLVDGAHGKLTPAGIDAGLASYRGGVHQVQPRVLSLTQATESGTVYTPAEMAALGDYARAKGWRLHVDGARFANAVAYLGCHPGEISAGAGAAALSFGAIKNGGMTAEAIVVFEAGLADDLRFRRKRAGQMPSKGRFQAAQLLAMIETGAAGRNAAAANAGAARIGAAAGARLLAPVEANEVFAALGEHAGALRAQGFDFYDWNDAGSGDVRLVVAWDTPAADIAALTTALAALPASPP